ncbi:MAG TPA: M14 family metallopeptidase [Gracilimonas sp.]|uniref:M14 family metallopeptidase n=1 Tax=Gracilimonas sp. TaxID=1974203 RepID=UPI002DAE74F4|nr:M14 family metallopeptidase [Gracilimonas sp.]
MYRLIWFVICFFCLTSCKSSKEFTGFSYDPVDVTNTNDKELDPQPKRIIGADSPKVWVSNEFDGARANDFYALNDSTFEVYIAPENAPINNSPWYAFKIWSDTVRMAKIQLNYRDATHRYVPKLLSWVQADSSWEEQWELEVEYDSTNGTATFDVLLANDPIIISGQPLHTSSKLKKTLWDREIIGHGFVKVREAGLSKLGRPIWELDITEVAEDQKAPVLTLVGRQHPPEVTGYLASLIFLEELTSDSELAKKFRQTFVVKAFPMINPDGVDLGHWRHNAGGVDLNRDWSNFNQPETRVIRDALSWMKNHDLRRMFYAIDFHSTNENLFYPINQEVKTTPDDFTQKWVGRIIENNPETEFRIEEFDTSSPIAKNWFYNTFGIDAITYEVDDSIDPEQLDSVSRSAANLLMELLLEEWEKSILEN